MKSRYVDTHHEGSVDVNLFAPRLLRRLEVHLSVESRVGGAARMAWVGCRERAEEKAGGHGNDGPTRQRRRQLSRLRTGRRRTDRTDEGLWTSVVGEYTIRRGDGS